MGKLLHDIEGIYLDIWLEKKINGQYYHDSVNKLNCLINKSLQQFDELANDEQGIIITLSEVELTDINHALEVIEKLLVQYNENWTDTKLNLKKISLLRQKVLDTIYQIKQHNSYYEAKYLFFRLERLQTLAAQIIYINYLQVDNFLRQVLYDFDRVDNDQKMLHIFELIKSDNYVS